MIEGVGESARTRGDVEQAVLARYATASQRPEADLCCPKGPQDEAALALLPREIVEVDYGCGDPTAWARPGDTVLDLGSGSGKACYLLAMKVGREGCVIGADFNDAMLALARRHQDAMAAKLGYRNVRFVKARVQSLALDLERVDAMLAESPLASAADLRAFQERCAAMQRESPLIASDSVDLVVSNCVLNLVRPEDKVAPFAEIHRVLRRGGRAVVSDIVCDEDPPPEMQADPELWSGCISGAFREDRFLEAFERAGFYGVEICARSAKPWRVVGGIEFRSVTVRAFKGKEGPCLERNQAVIYRGPWSRVEDDDGHAFARGRRIAVCDKTFSLLTDPRGPYAREVLPVPPRNEIPLEEAGPFACRGVVERHPRETKGAEPREDSVGPDARDADCSGGACC